MRSKKRKVNFCCYLVLARRRISLRIKWMKRKEKPKKQQQKRVILFFKYI